MDTNEKDLDVMTQEEIERFLAEQQENIGKEENVEADLTSLLSELEMDGDGDIQEISSLLNRADNNEAVAEDVVALMNKQDAEGETAYDAMDLFSGDETKKKENFFQRFLSRHKQKKQEKEKSKEAAKTEKAKKKEEKIAAKEQKAKAKEEQKAAKEQKSEDVSIEVDDVLTALTGDTVDNDKKIPKKKQKAETEKKPKKEKKKKAAKSKEELSNDPDEAEQSTEKQTKKKKVKEKKSKKNSEENESTGIREKTALQDAVEILEEEYEEPINKKKVLIVFFAAVMIMFGFIVVYFYFTGHANKKLAEEAYANENYLECYQLMYGQQLNDSQQAMFHRSELILKMEIFQKDYNNYIAKQSFLEALDQLVQFVYDYPKLSAYATEWNCLEIVQDTYADVVFVLEEDYTLTEQEVLSIARLESDVEYTRALVKLIEEKKRQDAWDLEYPDMLPPEQDRIIQSE